MKEKEKSLVQSINEAIIERIFASFDGNEIRFEDYVMIDNENVRLCSVNKDEKTVTYKSLVESWCYNTIITKNIADLSTEELIGIAKAIDTLKQAKEFTFWLYPQVVLTYKVVATSEEDAHDMLVKHIDASNLRSLDIPRKADWVDYDIVKSDNGPEDTDKPIATITQVSMQ